VWMGLEGGLAGGWGRRGGTYVVGEERGERREHAELIGGV